MKLIVFLLILIPFWVKAHPVSFQNSIGLMGYHSPDVSYHQLNYSFKPWFAMGIHYITLPQTLKSSENSLTSRLTSKASATFLSSNFLLKRWNSQFFQANLYMSLGLGKSQLSQKSSDITMYNLIQFDIENRKYYFLAKHWLLTQSRKSIFSEQKDIEQSIVRMGFSPYQDHFSGLHAWFILEWKKTLIQKDSKQELTPFLRLFYKNLLFEIGQSFRGIMHFNYIIHF